MYAKEKSKQTKKELVSDIIFLFVFFVFFVFESPSPSVLLLDMCRSGLVNFATLLFP